jgi:hypothetical protein
MELLAQVAVLLQQTEVLQGAIDLAAGGSPSERQGH